SLDWDEQSWPSFTLVSHRVIVLKCWHRCRRQALRGLFRWPPGDSIDRRVSIRLEKSQQQRPIRPRLDVWQLRKILGLDIPAAWLLRRASISSHGPGKRPSAAKLVCLARLCNPDSNDI